MHVTVRKFLNPAEPTSARSLTASAWRPMRSEEQRLPPARQRRTGSGKRPTASRPSLRPRPERRVRTGRSATGTSRWDLRVRVTSLTPPNCLTYCRKNPAHFQECSHPGDADYKEEEEPEDAERPECPYGTDCYRSGSGRRLRPVSRTHDSVWICSPHTGRTLCTGRSTRTPRDQVSRHTILVKIYIPPTTKEMALYHTPAHINMSNVFSFPASFAF